MTISHIILILVGLIQVLSMFILKRLFDTQDRIYKLIESNQKICIDRIYKNEEAAKNDRNLMKLEYTNLLDKHYVTNGQLNTLEAKLTGEIKQLSQSIQHLTEAIKSNFRQG